MKTKVVLSYKTKSPYLLNVNNQDTENVNVFFFLLQTFQGL